MRECEPTRQIFGEGLAEYGAKDDRIVVLTADVSGSVLTNYFEARFPERFFNVGIAEQGMIDTAAGLALGGMIPFANTFAALLLRTVEQIRSCVAYADTNVKIIGGYAGISDYKDGPTHHSITDIAIMRSLPNMAVIVPGDCTELRQMVPLVAQYPGPVYVRISRNDLPKIFDDSHKVEIGRGVTVREGSDVTIITCGHMLSRSLDAAEMLEKDGISARVLNIHTIKPLDLPLIKKCAEETGALVTAEEHSIVGGLGSAVAEKIAVEYPVPIEMVGIADRFTETALDHESLMDHYGMSLNDIVTAAKKAIGRKK